MHERNNEHDKSIPSQIILNKNFSNIHKINLIYKVNIKSNEKHNLTIIFRYIDLIDDLLLLQVNKNILTLHFNDSLLNRIYYTKSKKYIF